MEMGQTIRNEPMKISVDTAIVFWGGGYHRGNPVLSSNVFITKSGDQNYLPTGRLTCRYFQYFEKFL